MLLPLVLLVGCEERKKKKILLFGQEAPFYSRVVALAVLKKNVPFFVESLARYL